MLCGLLITVSSITALATNGTVPVNIAYRNIQIYINDHLIHPTDVTGRYVEPFIIDGTTYLPVRAVSEALGKTVSWNEMTSSIYINDIVSSPTPDYTPKVDTIPEVDSNPQLTDVHTPVVFNGPSSLNNPAPIGTEQLVTYSSGTASVRINSVERGMDAYKNLMSYSNSSTSYLKEGFEPIIINASVRLETKDSSHMGFDRSGIRCISSNGMQYESSIYYNSPKPVFFSSGMEVGEVMSGFFVFAVKVDDPAPVIRFGPSTEGKGAWFSTVY